MQRVDQQVEGIGHQHRGHAQQQTFAAAQPSIAGLAGDGVIDGPVLGQGSGIEPQRHYCVIGLDGDELERGRDVLEIEVGEEFG